MHSFRYDYTFYTDPTHQIRVKFDRDFTSIDRVQHFANHSHTARRTWARMLLSSYPDVEFVTLTPPDYNTEFGRIVQNEYPKGATLSIQITDTQTTLFIQVLLFSFRRQKYRRY